MEFIEAPAFSRHLPRYLDDEQYRRLQDALSNAPEMGDVIPGTGGFRKLRWVDVRGLMAVYDKNEAVDLTPAQRKILKEAIDAQKKSRAGR
jgi:uncharacterized protein (DUF1778 family)